MQFALQSGQVLHVELTCATPLPSHNALVFRSCSEGSGLHCVMDLSSWRRTPLPATPFTIQHSSLRVNPCRQWLGRPVGIRCHHLQLHPAASGAGAPSHGHQLRHACAWGRAGHRAMGLPVQVRFVWRRFRALRACTLSCPSIAASTAPTLQVLVFASAFVRYLLVWGGGGWGVIVSNYVVSCLHRHPPSSPPPHSRPCGRNAHPSWLLWCRVRVLCRNVFVSLYMGWSCVACIANVAVALTPVGEDVAHAGLGAHVWSIVMQCVAASLAVVFCVVRWCVGTCT